MPVLRIILVVGCFLATVLGGDRLVFLIAKELIRHSQNQFVRMYEGEGAAEVLFFGDSRVDRNISFEKVQELTGKTCLNLGLGGNSLLVSEALLKDYLQRYRRPELIVIELGHSTVNPSTLGEMRVFSYCSTNITALARSADPTYEQFATVFPSLRLNDPAFWRLASEVAIPPSTRLLHNKIPQAIIDHWKSASPVHRPIYDANLEALRRILELTDAEQIRVELVISPCWLGFRKAVVNYEEWVVALQRSAGVHAIRDYSDLFSDAPDYFNDELHLNAAGAERFVMRLSDDGVL